MLKRTPLFEAHQKLSGRLIEFGGWEMPVQYTSIMDEHNAVRKAAGIFDISHMGEVRVSGPNAETFLNFVLTNDVRKLAVGLGQYTLLCNPQGGVIDDLYLYRLGVNEYFLIINASRIEEDVAWLVQELHKFFGKEGVTLTDESAISGAVAVQGPRVVEFIDRAFPGKSLTGASVETVSQLKKNEIGQFAFESGKVLVSRTGYTGEDGFEIVTSSQLIGAVWSKLLALGHPHCLQPAGLGARDTLRTEVCYPLYGHELNETTTPIEAGLGFFVALEKGEFNGRAVLSQQKAAGVAKKSIAFKMTEKSAPPRPGYAIYGAGEATPIGEVVSGTQSPSLKQGIGMGYVKTAFAPPGTPIEIEIRGKRSPAVVAAKPLYRRPAKS